MLVYYTVLVFSQMTGPCCNKIKSNPGYVLFVEKSKIFPLSKENVTIVFKSNLSILSPFPFSAREFVRIRSQWDNGLLSCSAILCLTNCDTAIANPVLYL